MVKIAFVNFANGSYQHTQQGLIESLRKHTNYDILNFTSYEQLECKPHSDSPYGFKVYAIEIAKNLGYDIVIWCDSPMRLLRPIDEWIPLITKHGVYLQRDGWFCGQWANDRTLAYFNKSRDDAMNIPNIYACVMGFDFRTDIARKFLDEFIICEKLSLFKGLHHNRNHTESNDVRCLGHRHDQSCAELIADKLNIHPNPFVFSYDTNNKNRFFTAWDHE